VSLCCRCAVYVALVAQQRVLESACHAVAPEQQQQQQRQSANAARRGVQECGKSMKPMIMLYFLADFTASLTRCVTCK